MNAGKRSALVILSTCYALVGGAQKKATLREYEKEHPPIVILIQKYTLITDLMYSHRY